MHCVKEYSVKHMKLATFVNLLHVYHDYMLGL
jgi:hypothetical protein